MGPAGPWDEMREAVRRTGYALLHAQVDDWLPALARSREVHRLLGAEAGRLKTIESAATRARFTTSRLLVKSAAGALLDADPADLELARDPNGRPCLRGFSGLGVALSHTGRVVAVGLSGLGPIGVDVESPDRPAYATGLAEDICTAYERSVLDRLPGDARNAAVIRLWTLKEAYSKALGLGLRLPFRSFGFTTEKTPGGVARLLTADGRPASDEGWRFETHPLEGGCTLSAAVGPTAFAATGVPSAAGMVDQGLMRAVVRDLSERRGGRRDAHGADGAAPADHTPVRREQ